jgi:hypothetical protein
VVSVPNGPGASAIDRPGPPDSTYTFPAGPVISAVTSGPGLGPDINGLPTDLITVLAADTAFEGQCLTALGANSMTVGEDTNITDGGPDDIRSGDLIMLMKAGITALMYVTGVAGQTVTFGAGDPLGLNQYDPSLAMLGTFDQLRAAAPVDNGPRTCNVAPPGLPGISTVAFRVRMISYYLDAATDPGNPRLVRRLNGDAGRAVAFGVENLQLSYDLSDGASNPANVRMDATDLGAGGACAPNPCSLNQIRKVNIFLAGRSRNRFSLTDDFLRNTLTTQVSLRNLAFVDRYR